MIRKPRAIALYALLLISWTGLSGASAEGMQGVKRVGIISVVGDKFDFRKIGLTVFNNELNAVPVSWGIDEFVTNRIRALLGRRYEVRPVSFQRAAIANAGEGLIDALQKTSLTDVVRSSVTPAGVDAYIIVRPAVSQFASTNQNLAGFGVLTTGGLITNSESVVHTLYSVIVIDAHQFTEIEYATAAPFDQSLGAILGFGECPGVHGPCRKIDNSMVPASHNAADIAKFRSMVVEMIDKSLPDVLRRAQLIN
jgi:hypothetical protein